MTTSGEPMGRAVSGNEGPKAGDVTAERERLQQRSAAQLRALAAEWGVPHASRLRKDELIEALLAAGAEAETAPGVEKLEPSPGPAKWPRTALGWLLRLSGGLGAVLSLAGVITVVVLTEGTVEIVEAMMASAAQETRRTAASLRLVSASMHQAAETLDVAAEALTDVEDGLVDGEVLLETTGVLLGERVPTALEATHDSLLAAQGGAKAIDVVLRFMAGIPFVGGEYNPEQSLDKSLADTAAGIAPLPDELRRAQEDLERVSANFDQMDRDLQGLVGDLRAFSDGLVEVDQTLAERGESLDALADRFETGVERASTWVKVAAAVVTLGLIWLGFGQLAVYAVGVQLSERGA